jgi:signal transduction histidine kinase
MLPIKITSSLTVFLFFCFAFCSSCKEHGNEQHIGRLVDSIANKITWIIEDSLKKEHAAKKLKSVLKEKAALSLQTTYNAYKGLFHYCYHSGKFNQAISYADSMIYVIEHADADEAENFRKELADAYYFKGDALGALRDNKESYESYIIGKTLFPTIIDSCTNSANNYRIAKVLYRQNRFVKAGTHFRKSLQELETCGTSEFRYIFKKQELLSNIALCYSETNKTDSALLFFSKALSLINENDTIAKKKQYYEMARGVIYGNMGGEMLKKDAYAEAEELMLKSIAINDKPGYLKDDATTVKIKLIKLYLETGNNASASKYLTILNEDIKRTNRPKFIQSYHFLMADYYKKLGRQKEALSHLNRYIKLTDSLQSQFEKEKSINVDERFKNLNKENEINRLKKEAVIKQRYLNFYLTLIVMGFFIVSLIYFYWRKSRRTIHQLTALNNEISLQKDQLQDAFVKLGASDKEKDTILRTVAHDLRNPVVGISSLTKIMMEEDADKVNTGKLKMIDDACGNALHLIDDIIEAAENKAGLNIEDNKTNENLVLVIDKAISILTFRAKEKLQRVSFKRPSENLMLRIYKEKIQRVVGNLISNAIKFSEKGKEIVLEIKKFNDYVLVSVSDHGIGIPQEMGNNVFDFFSTSKRFGTDGEKSYGLGLSICKQIIMAHGGEIWYEGNEQGGTTFNFTLPL